MFVDVFSDRLQAVPRHRGIYGRRGGQQEAADHLPVRAATGVRAGLHELLSEDSRAASATRPRPPSLPFRVPIAML